MRADDYRMNTARVFSVRGASAFIAILLLLLSAQSCAKDSGRHSVTYTDVFDTVCTITGYTDTKDEFDGIIAVLHEKLTDYHRLCDIYNSYDGMNNLKTLNDNAGVSPVALDTRLIELLMFARNAYKITDGRVNVMLGSVLSVWHKYRTEGVALPPHELLEAASKHTGIESLIIDAYTETAVGTAYIVDAGASVDVGATAKGYVTQKLCEYIRESGHTSFLLDIGGNVCAVGEKPREEKWTVGIDNPDGGILRYLNISSGAVVTSGDYQRYYEVDGKRYCHIIDPGTLMPSASWRSVTVIMSDSAAADMLSTALFILPLSEGRELTESLKQSYGDINVVWINTDNVIFEN